MDDQDLLMERDTFRNAVFARDGNKCVICDNKAADAHHIMERKLWDDGGYYLQNGASLCAECHIKAEQTLLSVEEIREKSGIKNGIIPDHLYPDEIYDKWANSILPNGSRIKGELFYDLQVQKILASANLLGLFLKYIKYPRTFHLPFSLGLTKDDRQIKSCQQFEGKRIIITEKRDGECTSVYYDGYMHARSLDTVIDFTRSYVKNQVMNWAYDLPEGWRVCGENLWAIHSIEYRELTDYFEAFSIWDNTNRCLGWDETMEYLGILGIKSVPVLYDGTWDEELVRNLYSRIKDKKGDEIEGFVIRLAEEFGYGQFRKSLAKLVRADHVKTDQHWKKNVHKNRLAGN